MPDIRYRAALTLAMKEEMAQDDSVVLLGQDVGRLGGSFAVSRGLLDEFGADRVIETPISESAIVGAAVGMAMMGKRPIAELMFSDFLTLGMDHIVNTAAKAIFSAGGQVELPLVVRMPYGATCAGMHHDQSPESWIANVPGLKIVFPATVADARALLRASVRDPNPVVFFEHKALYRLSGDADAPTLPLGKARVAREGRDVTVVAYGAMVQLAEKVAGKLAADGVEVEVIDLRSIRPLDMDTVLASVERTGRAVIIHEAHLFYGVGAEIAAQLNETLFGRLKAPVRRVGAPDYPVPVHLSHRKAYLPDEDALTGAIRSTLS